MRVRFFGHWGALTGYGRACRDTVAALNTVDDVELEVVPIELLGTDDQLRVVSPEPRYAHLDHLVRGHRDLGRVDVEIVHHEPRSLVALATHQVIAPRTADRRMAMTTWETSYCPFATTLLRNYVRVFVPSTFCQNVLIRSVMMDDPDLDEHHADRSILRRHIGIAPHPYDVSFWRGYGSRARATHPMMPEDYPLRFYTTGAWNERKNPAGVLKAYLHAFTRADPVQLSMYCPGADLNEIRSIIARAAIPEADLPRLRVEPTALAWTEEQIRAQHLQNDCYVSASRGEGWGFGMFEAAATGNEVIVPDYGGQLDYLDIGTTDRDDEVVGTIHPGSYFVPGYMTPCLGSEVRGEIVRAPDGSMMQTSRVSIPPGLTVKQAWYEPSLVQMATHMRLALSRSDMAFQDDGERAAYGDHLRSRYSYDRVGADLYELLRTV